MKDQCKLKKIEKAMLYTINVNLQSRHHYLTIEEVKIRSLIRKPIHKIMSSQQLLANNINTTHLSKIPSAQPDNICIGLGCDKTKNPNKQL